MYCSLSGVVADVPVVSILTGHIYEKRIIEKHLQSSSTCPHTNQSLDSSQLLPIVIPAHSPQSVSSIKPRPPAFNSIPSLLSTLQSEWDNAMLETFHCKQYIEQLKKELALSLYQHDAACRVIARTIKERDEAKALLADTQRNLSSAVNGAPPASAANDSNMELDENRLSSSILAQLADSNTTLSKTRTKRIKELSSTVISKEQLSTFHVITSAPLHSTSTPGITSLDIDSTQNSIATGGNDGTTIIFNKSTKSVSDSLNCHSQRVTDVKFHPTEPILFTASLDHTATVWKSTGNKYSLAHTWKDHSAAVVGVSVHAHGKYAVTASADSSWIFYDVETGKSSLKVQDAKINTAYSSVSFHPDGLLLGLGNVDNSIRIFDIKTSTNVVTLEAHKFPVTSIAFSENGKLLASADQSGVVRLWDLRHLSNIQTFESTAANNTVNRLHFDVSGSYLGIASKQDVRIYNSKSWEIVNTWKDHKEEVTSVYLANNLAYFASASIDRTLKIYSN